MKLSVGLDIGTECVKLAALEKIDNAYKLDGFGFSTYGGDENKLKDFVKGSGYMTEKIRVNIESPNLKIRRLDLPMMPEEEIDEAVKWGMSEVIKDDLDDYIFRHVALDPVLFKLEKNIPLVVYAIRKGDVESRLSLVRSLGFKRPMIVEPNASALSSIFQHCCSQKADGWEMIIDFGNSISNFVVVGKEGLVYSRPLSSCADRNLVDQTAMDLGVEVKRAQEIKRLYFGEKVSVEAAVIDPSATTLFANTVSHFFSRVALEVQRSMEGFFSIYGRQRLETINICGGGSSYRGIVESLKKELEIDVKIFDPLSRINLNKFPPAAFEGNRPLFAVACGLAVD